jgi:molybdate transport system substrate-binding protein
MLSKVLGAALLSAILLFGAVACGDDSKGSSDDTASASATPKATGDLTVFAAASLTEAFGGAEQDLEGANPGLDITYSFAGSGALVTQVEQGAPADVIATADLTSMQRLVDAGLVEAPTTFARNQLEILVAPGNPHDVDSLADLADPDLVVVLADDTVPAGKYAAQALAAAGVSVSPVSKELDVKAAVSKVTLGEADATIVYVTDVTAAGSKGEGVQIPDAQNVVAEYPIAIVKATDDHAAAEAFVESVVSGVGHRALQASGFLAAA